GGFNDGPMAQGCLATDFLADQTSVQCSATVNFTDLTTGSPTQWNWDFGDGFTSSSQSPSHPYNVSGDYDVNLTVRDGSNNTDTKTKMGYIHVSPSGGNLSANFSYFPTSNIQEGD